MLEDLLNSWEETYKKGQLTLWIFLSLKDGSKYVNEIKTFIEINSDGTISCEEQSLYRSLRKFNHVDVVKYGLKEGNRGPDRKYYSLTSLGESLLETFIQRNIKLFFSSPIKKLME
jgi:DNA-binding PadR family transcriptional regulator|tara:strand:- start:54 stop:401 length:348 start_codon:yes stop_codon:yes gene_type:complete